MGYTHYWYRKQEIDQNIFVRIKMDFERVLPALAEKGIQLGNGFGLGFPIRDGDTILFNGAGEQGYEGMHFPRIMTVHPDEKPNEQGHHFEFCKTNQRPYDLAVTVFLLIVKNHLKDDVIVRSDGDKDDWEMAEELYKQIFQSNHLPTSNPTD